MPAALVASIILLASFLPAIASSLIYMLGLVLIPLLILFHMPYFNNTAGEKYDERSLKYLTWGYFIGQMIVCYLVLFASLCLAFLIKF